MPGIKIDPLRYQASVPHMFQVLYDQARVVSPTGDPISSPIHKEVFKWHTDFRATHGSRP